MKDKTDKKSRDQKRQGLFRARRPDDTGTDKRQAGSTADKGLASLHTEKGRAPAAGAGPAATAPVVWKTADGLCRAHTVFCAGDVAVLEWSATFPCPETPEAGKESLGACVASGEKPTAKGRGAEGGKPRKSKRGRPDAGEARRRIAAFYGALRAACEAYVAGPLLSRIRGEYAADEGPRKRYTFCRYRLFSDARVTQEGGGYYSVRRTTRLMRGGRCVLAREEAEVFSLTSGLLLPLYALLYAGIEPAAGGRPGAGQATDAAAIHKNAQDRPTSERRVAADKGKAPEAGARSSRWARVRRGDRSVTASTGADAISAEAKKRARILPGRFFLMDGRLHTLGEQAPVGHRAE